MLIIEGIVEGRDVVFLNQKTVFRHWMLCKVRDTARRQESRDSLLES